MNRIPTPGYGILVRLEIPNKPGRLGAITSAIGRAGGDIGSIDIVGFGKDSIIRDIAVNVSDIDMGQMVVDEIKLLAGVKVLGVTDRTFKAHEGGKIEIRNKISLKTREDLSMVYTPGVARVSLAIKEDKERAYDFSIKRNSVAIVTDGTAVLGLGDVGPEAALPVMEGKAMLFKEFGNVDAFPICLSTKNPDEIVSAVTWIASGFGGINLEDISSPRCFEIEERLRKELDIPVFHDDQHGTAVVVLAGLLNALKIVDKQLEDIRVVVSGIGAAGTAVIRLLLAAGVRYIIGTDSKGILYRGRKENMNRMKELLAERTNPENVKGDLPTAMKGADVFLGLSRPSLLTRADIKQMARDPIVFAMANPDPEISPDQAAPHARIIATGRSDYPNQINNVLCFPGLFRGILDCHAREINNEMLFAAARAIASMVDQEKLAPDYIIPSVLDCAVPEKVAHDVRKAAVQTGAARLEEHYFSFYRL